MPPLAPSDDPDSGGYRWKRIIKDAGEDLLHFTVADFNGGGWGPIKEWLPTLPHECRLAFIQEHRLPWFKIADAQAFLQSLGWHGVFEAAKWKDAGWSSGVAILAKVGIGLGTPEGGSVVYEGRSISAVVELPEGKQFVAYSNYFITGIGFKGDNLKIAAELGRHFQLQRAKGWQWLAGGDHNFIPSDLHQHGFLDRVRGHVLAPPDHTPTCEMGTGSAVYDCSFLRAV